MHKNRKEIKIILKIIKPFGYSVVAGKKHHKIVDKDGHCLIGMASSPSEPHWYKNVINDLIRRGLLPGVKKL